MKICIIGLWHLGLITTVTLAKMGHKLRSFDNEKIIKKLNLGKFPINEKNLINYYKKYRKNIKFENINNNFKNEKIFWLTFDTPLDENDNFDHQKILIKFKYILKKIPKNAIIIISSQIPIGTIGKLQSYDKLVLKKKFSFFYVPENLRLGSSIKNFLNPDRIIIGTDITNKTKINIIKKIFRKINCQKYIVNSETAEMSKHVINSFLANSISFINEIAMLGRNYDINFDDLEKTVKSDRRIGFKSYLKSGFSFSGGTLARDVNILKETSRKNKVPLILINNIIRSNSLREKNIINLIKKNIPKKKNIQILQIGITYKKGTNTLRRSFPYKVYEIFNSLKNCKIELIDNDIDKNYFNKLMQNFKKKYDLIIIFKKNKYFELILKKNIKKNTKVIDIGRLYNKYFIDNKNYYN